MTTLAINPTYAGYVDRGPNSLVQTNVGGGMPRTQLDLVGGVAVVSLRFVLSTWQHQYWKAFYYTTIREGSLPFEMTLDLDGYDATYEVQIVGGSDTTGQAYVNAKELTFQVYAQPIIDGAYMGGIVEIYNAYGNDLNGAANVLDGLNQFANIDSNVLDF